MTKPDSRRVGWDYENNRLTAIDHGEGREMTTDEKKVTEIVTDLIFEFNRLHVEVAKRDKALRKVWIEAAEMAEEEADKQRCSNPDCRVCRQKGKDILLLAARFRQKAEEKEK